MVRLVELSRREAGERGWEVEVMPGRVHLFVKHRPDILGFVCGQAVYVAKRCTGIAFRGLREEFPRLKLRLPTLSSLSYVPASVGAVSAEMVRWYVDIRWERLWTNEGASS